MGLPAYIYQNFLSGTGDTSSTEDSNFPTENLSDGIAANPFKFTTTSGYVEHDDGASQTADSVVIINHNMPSASFVGTIYAGNSPNPVTKIEDLIWRSENLWRPFASTSFRYARVNLSVSGSTAISLGELIIESRVAMPRAPRWGIVKGKESRGVTHRTYGGVTWDYDHYTTPFLRPTFRFPESEYASFELFSDRVGRNPFVWIPDVELTNVYYVKKARGFYPTSLGPYRDGSSIAVWYDWTVEMEMESTGLAITA